MRLRILLICLINIDVNLCSNINNFGTLMKEMLLNVLDLATIEFL